MTVLAWLALAALAVWVYLVAARGGFWRTDQRLPRAGGRWRPAGGRWPRVVAIVPARDEAAILPRTLPTLLGQDYPGDLGVVLVDDHSADATARVAGGLAEGAPRHLTVVRGEEPPDGWAGKVWAMAQGAATATRTDPATRMDGAPDYLWLTDADVAHAPGTLAALVGAAESDRRDLVSQMALLRTETGWERAVVPAFVYLFAMLYPFRWVNRPGARTAAAAGGCMLVRREALEAAGGLARIKGARIDDVALARLLKRRPGGGHVWLGLATGVSSRRPYPRLADLWSMIARSAYTQLRYSPALLAGTVAGLLLLYAVPPVAAVAGLGALALGAGAAAGWAAAAGVAAWALMSASYLPVLRLYRLSPLRGPSLAAIAMIYAAITVDAARRYHTGHVAIWKGRPAPRRAPARD